MNVRNPDARPARRVRFLLLERGVMDNQIEKLLYSREDAAAALSISIRSVDYLIAEGKVTTRRIGRKNPHSRRRHQALRSRGPPGMHSNQRQSST